MESCKTYGQGLYFASKELRDDREIVKQQLQIKV